MKDEFDTVSKFLKVSGYCEGSDPMRALKSIEMNYINLRVENRVYMRQQQPTINVYYDKPEDKA